MARKMTKAERERYTRFLIQFRELSWNAFVDATCCELEDMRPEWREAVEGDDYAFSMAKAAFQRHSQPFGGGRGATPKALRWDYGTGEWLLPA